MTDLSGRTLLAARTVQVLPNPDSSPPTVTITSTTPVDGDWIVPGKSVSLPVVLTDNQLLERYALLVNGVEGQGWVDVEQASVSTTLTWTPPAGAVPGTVYTLRIEARDYAANVGFAERTVRLAYGTILTAGQDLDAGLEGQTVVLANGTFVAQDDLHLAVLVLVDGATLDTPTGQDLEIVVDGLLRVEAGTKITAASRGFGGGVAGHPAGYAPSWVTGSLPDAGGTHGGYGVGKTVPGRSGEPYDSVYAPRLPGAGGSQDDDGSGNGLSGGGVVGLEFGTMVLDGTITADGASNSDASRPAGAGGSVWLRGASLSGTGSITVIGGYSRTCYSTTYVGPGGGGRVALHVDDLGGFDPVAQVQTRGGIRYFCNWSYESTAAGGGTLVVKDQASVYGELIVDHGVANGADMYGPPTEMPALGAGSVSGWEISGADAWLTGVGSFPPRWLGAWVAVEDVAG
jgi:hypothetical protein